MNKETALEIFEEEIKLLHHSGDIVKSIKKGKIYKIETQVHKYRQDSRKQHSIVRLKSFNKLSVRFDVIASDYLTWEIERKMRDADERGILIPDKYEYGNIEEWEEWDIKKEDIPLYINYAYLSAYFKKKYLTKEI